MSTIRCLAARRHSDIAVGVELRDEEDSSWSYELAFNQDNQRHPVVRTERVLRNADVILERPDEEDRRDPARLTQTHLEQVSANQPFRDLAAFFASIRYRHIVPQLVRQPHRSAGRSNDPFGADFLERVARTSARTRDARMRRIQNALGAAVPQLEDAGQLSDGTLRLMGLLWATMDGRGPLLLEEPELSLHPEIVRALPQMLARVQRRRGSQIFLSTHSPDLLRDTGIGLDETLLFMPEKSGTDASPATSVGEIGQLLDAGLSLAEIVLPRTRPAAVSRLALFADA